MNKTINELSENYKRYKWFFTSSNKLVIGGKSAEQNDSLISLLKSQEKDFIVMHTSSPGSPFSVIVSYIENVTKSDIKECAVFTACFSQSWKKGKKKESVDIFRLSQLTKKHGMKTGLWLVLGEIERVSVDLSLVLTAQKGALRAVPKESAAKKDVFIGLVPGKEDKKKIIPKLSPLLKKKFSENDFLSALPSGGIKLVKTIK